MVAGCMFVLVHYLSSSNLRVQPCETLCVCSKCTYISGKERVQNEHTDIKGRTKNTTHQNARFLMTKLLSYDFFSAETTLKVTQEDFGACCFFPNREKTSNIFLPCKKTDKKDSRYSIKLFAIRMTWLFYCNS